MQRPAKPCTPVRFRLQPPHIMKIKLKNCGTSFESSENESILNSALKNNIFLDHSCKSGQCSSCKTKVISGETEPLQSELTLSENEKKDGYILTCCRRALSEVHLDSENLEKFKDIKQQRIPSKIFDIQTISDSFLILSLRLHPDSKFDYISGQYVSISRSKITRHYSIFDFDNNEKILKLYIKNYSSGALSNYLFHEAEVGDLIQVFGPHGTFCFDETKLDSENIFFATGTGIAPFFSMLQNLEQKKLKAKIKLFWGNRRQEEFFNIPDFEYIDLETTFCLSQESIQNFYYGYIQDAFLETQIGDIKSVIPYICGSENMIESVTNLIRKLGYSGPIKSDYFVSYKS